MSAWNRSGPVVVEVDGTAENLRVVDYAAIEALRVGVELMMIAVYPERGPFDPRQPASASKPAAEAADGAVQAGVAHVRYRHGYAVRLTAVTGEGARMHVLAQAGRKARMLVVGRSRDRGPQRLMHTQSNLVLADRAGCPVVVVPVSWKPCPVEQAIAVGIDGTELSSGPLEVAFGMAACREADLIVVHAGLPAEYAANGGDPEHSWISRAGHVLSETLAPWTSHFPDVKVTRFLTSRPPAAALVHESSAVGMIVVGAQRGPAVDPVARRSVAAMTCPVTIVPHR